jgi:UDP-N-acetylmuramate--alanine ligase
LSLAGARRVHFIGVGGAGMSAIAKVLLERGYTITGSDLKRSRAATILEAMGADVRIGHSTQNLVDADPDVVVVSTAIPEGNPELKEAQSRHIEIMSRGQALAAILEDRRSIVVAGTHGKTTTTSMIVSTLRHAGLDPTYLVGGGLNDVGTNAKHGHDEIAVAESDESDGSFLLLFPSIGVVTNIEADHLDYWGTAEKVKEGFGRFLSQVKEGGAAVVPSADPELVSMAVDTGREVVRFGTEGEVACRDVTLEPEGARFVLEYEGESAEASLRVPGEHNVMNALAAAAACLRAGVSLTNVAGGLGEFSGVERRFQVRGTANGVTVIDDYAHHPTEVKATLAATRRGPWDRVVAVFQPHRYSRTRALGRAFGDSFVDADHIVVTDVFGAGEQPVPGVTGKLIADAVCNKLPGRPVAYLPHRTDLLSYLEYKARPGDALLTLGAGDISTLGEELLIRLGGRT